MDLYMLAYATLEAVKKDMENSKEKAGTADRTDPGAEAAAKKAG